MDDQEPTPWEEINPVLRRESSVPAVASSRAALAVRLENITDLTPVDRAEFYAEVAPCLTLAAGVGMSQADQRAWLEAAFIALEDVPIGLLRRGAQAALRSADHPSKIVPAIVAEITDSWKWRREQGRHASLQSPTPAPPERQIEAPMTAAQIEEMNAIMARVGAATRYRPDGSRFEAETTATRRETRGPLRTPSRADYLEMGVEPSVLDEISMQRAAG